MWYLGIALTYPLKLLGLWTWDSCSILSDLPAHYPFSVTSIIAKLFFLEYGFCYIAFYFFLSLC